MSIKFNFENQVTVVTGGASGIGKAVAIKLRDSGAQVHIWDIKSGDVGGVKYHNVDVTSADDIAKVLAAIGPRIDVLVNCAGAVGRMAPFEDFRPAELRLLFELNFFAAAEICRQVVPIMRKANAGRIVNVASNAAKVGSPNMSGYSAAKAAVVTFTKAIAKELAPTKIRVNSITPGLVETEILTQLPAVDVQALRDTQLTGRGAKPEEVANIILFLASEDAILNVGATFDATSGRGHY